MDDLFKNIANHLNKTVMKDIDFNEKNKDYVRKSLSKRRSNRFSLKSIFTNLLPISLTGLLFIGGTYYFITELEIFPQEKQLASTDNYEGEPQKPINESPLYTPPIQEESFENMTKEDVVRKLLNSVDYFHTATGKFEEHVTYYDDSVSTTIVEYTLSIKNKIGGIEKITDLFDEKVMGSEERIQEYVYNHEKIWYIDSENKTYHVNSYEPQPAKEMTTPEKIADFKFKKIYENNEIFRERPPIGASGMSLFPYEFAASYLKNMQLWEIEKQNEKLLGHNTIVLNGKMDEKVITKTKLKETTDTFRFWVDKDTGILIKYETYDVGGQLISYLHPEKLEINVPVDLRKFVPNLEGYNKKETLDKF